MADFSLFLRERGSSSFINVQETDGYVAVEEYDNWFVRPHQAIDVYILWGDEYLLLSRREGIDGYVWPNLQGKAWKKLRRGQHTAGYLTLYKRVGKDYQPLVPRLYIASADLYENQYAALLARIGQLAVADIGAVTAPVAGLLPSKLSNSGQWLHSPIVYCALTLLQFYECCLSAWPHIEAIPARSMAASIRRVAIDSRVAQRSSVLPRRISERPGRPSVNLPVTVESFDCLENQFLLYVLGNFLSRVDDADGGLQRFATDLRSSRQKPPDDEKHANALWQRAKNSATNAAQEIDRLRQRLQIAKTWATHRQKSKLFRNVSPRLVHQPSLWLLRSAGYADVYRAFRQLVGDVTRQAQLDPIRRGLVEQTIRPSADLYQIWLFVEIYSMLQEKFGFRLVGQGPFERLHLSDGQLSIREGEPILLELQVAGREATYQIRLYYEQEWEYRSCLPGKACFIANVCQSLPCYTVNDKVLRPDIVLETTHAGKKHWFVIDAKYRRYAQQRGRKHDLEEFEVSNQFDADVLGTAKQKYFDGLAMNAAFIVHSDSDRQYTYFGEQVFRTPPHRERAARIPQFAAHKYGAVYAVPTELTSLEILLRCLLMYHAGWYDICWTCGAGLTPIKSEGRRGEYYQCKHGHDFWVDSVCQVNTNHQLLKLGEMSFHRTTRDNIWNCVCPQCGNEYEKGKPKTRDIVEPPYWVGRDTNL
jgi:hypothetical protein